MSESYFGLFGLEDERQAAMAEEATPKQVTTPENAEQILNSNACCICRSKQIKYRCPACGFRTCSADCVKQHKATFSCSGVRNKIPFVKISEYTENQFYDGKLCVSVYSCKLEISHNCVCRPSFSSQIIRF